MVGKSPERTRPWWNTEPSHSGVPDETPSNANKIGPPKEINHLNFRESIQIVQTIVDRCRPIHPSIKMQSIMRHRIQRPEPPIEIEGWVLHPNGEMALGDLLD